MGDRQDHRLTDQGHRQKYVIRPLNPPWFNSLNIHMKFSRIRDYQQLQNKSIRIGTPVKQLPSQTGKQPFANDTEVKYKRPSYSNITDVEGAANLRQRSRQSGKCKSKHDAMARSLSSTGPGRLQTSAPRKW